ncbi:MAG: PHP domain-containing protein [Archaeoglobaceae archaeon]
MYDLHIHSLYSDGDCSVDSIAKKAKECGLSAIAIVDHSIEHPMGLTRNKAKKRYMDIENARAKYDMEIINGIECGILADGKVVLPEFDFDLVLASMHDIVPMDEYYRRIELCLKRNDIDILGHFHAELFNVFDGANEKKDEEILELLMENDVGLEVNTGHYAPPESVLGKCPHKRIKYSVGSDSHSLSRVGDVKWGFRMANKFFKRGKSII